MTRLASKSSPDIVPKNKSATRNANRIIRKGVILKDFPALPTPITAFIALIIKTKTYLNTLLLTLIQILLLGLLLV
jgi:hypothetical protein